MTAISTPTTTTAPTGEGETHEFRPRRVRFDYDATPDHWVPGDPHTTHVANVLHLLLPAGERWFCDVYRKALPYVDDPTLARDVKAFMGQEATHARAHQIVLDDLDARGIDHQAFTRFVERGFGLVPAWSGPRRGPTALRRFIARRYLLHQLAGIAAIEHFTAVMGWWIVTEHGLDEAGADPQMMALLRWHGAEEVEHRSVAFDTYRAVGGGYLLRCLYMLVVFVGMFSLWIAGTHHLLRNDPGVARGRRHASVVRFVRAGRAGRLPSAGLLARAVPRYLRRSYHPADEGSTEVAAAYLRDAPGVTARR